MTENEGQFNAPAVEGQSEDATLSPTEKIEGEKPPGSVEPGAENPESDIKGEFNPNTE